MKKEKPVVLILLVVTLVFLGTSQLWADPENKNHYQNVLITNDNGVRDLPLLVNLAKAVKKYSENVVVVVANVDKSGTSNQSTVVKKGLLKSDCIIADQKNHIWVYVVDGYPADCVILGSLGIYHERGLKTDLVISGINGGANEGPSWFGSGTVGAARTAAFMGIPAVAVSGIHKSDPTAQKSVSAWVADFITTDMVKNIKSLEYFTVSVPRDMEKIKGAKVVERDVSIIGMMTACLARANKSETKAGQRDYWTISIMKNDAGEMVHKRDLHYFNQGYIVIVPMTIDENNYKVLKEKESLDAQLPEFKILK
jgi:5'-nucleotidase